MEQTFLSLFKKFISFHENTSNPFDRRKANTIQAYKNRYTLIQEFLFEKEMIDLMPTKFSITCARGFMEWLGKKEKQDGKKYSHNYCVRGVEACRAVLQYAASHEIIPFNPLQALRLQKEAPNKPTYLTPEEIQSVLKYEAPDSMTEKARDMFIFQCYTGFDYVDLITVNKKNIVNHRVKSIKDGIIEVKHIEFLIKERNKSSVEANIPYMIPAKEIFERHGYNMKLLSNPKYNKALKDLAIDCYIDKHLTTHIGRKTFAMMVLNQLGYSIQAVSKMLGHKTVKTTETYYAQVNLELVSREQMLLGL